MLFLKLKLMIIFLIEESLNYCLNNSLEKKKNQKTMKNVRDPKLATSDVLFSPSKCSQSKDIQFTMMKKGSSKLQNSCEDSKFCFIKYVKG